MKSFCLLILAILLLPIFIFASDNPSKYALIIAVADYPEAGGWKDISSDNDISLIKDALLKQGFTEEKIKIILNEEADKNGIVNELKNPTNKVDNGDIVVVHFSGHGQQIRDNENMDEIDGYNESIIQV